MTAYLLFCAFSVGNVHSAPIPLSEAIRMRAEGTREMRLAACKREFRRDVAFAWVGSWE